MGKDRKRQEIEFTKHSIQMLRSLANEKETALIINTICLYDDLVPDYNYLIENKKDIDDNVLNEYVESISAKLIQYEYPTMYNQDRIKIALLKKISER